MILSLLYNLSIHAMGLGIKVISKFNKKMQLFTTGREDIFDKISKKLENNKKSIAWFHCASLGEFEQAKPVIESFKNQFPDFKIFLTFFSPSGYEVRKNEPIADYIFYLPLDTKSNAKRFVELIQPKVALFVKYEFWPNYIQELKRLQIKTISFSTILRKDQVFFRWYGGFYRNVLRSFDAIFVQNETSKKLLQSIDYKPVYLGGDTRFDQVIKICEKAKKNTLVEKFKGENLLLVIGSSWLSDMEVLYPIINAEHKNLKFVIAPHNIKEDEIAKMKETIGLKTIVYSALTEENSQEHKVLIIDNYGLLSSLYGYADFAYIGGGFNKGLHNTLEAATFGIPLFFGKDETNKKFQEATDLLKIESASEVENKEELKEKFTLLLYNSEERERKGKLASDYVKKKAGATHLIMKYMNTLINKN